MEIKQEESILQQYEFENEVSEMWNVARVYSLE